MTREEDFKQFVNTLPEDKITYMCDNLLTNDEIFSTDKSILYKYNDVKHKLLSTFNNKEIVSTKIEMDTCFSVMLKMLKEDLVSVGGKGILKIKYINGPEDSLLSRQNYFIESVEGFEKLYKQIINLMKTNVYINLDISLKEKHPSIKYIEEYRDIIDESILDDIINDIRHNKPRLSDYNNQRIQKLLQRNLLSFESILLNKEVQELNNSFLESVRVFDKFISINTDERGNFYCLHYEDYDCKNKTEKQNMDNVFNEIFCLASIMKDKYLELKLVLNTAIESETAKVKNKRRRDKIFKDYEFKTIITNSGYIILSINDSDCYKIRLNKSPVKSTINKNNKGESTVLGKFLLVFLQKNRKEISYNELYNSLYPKKEMPSIQEMKYKLKSALTFRREYKIPNHKYQISLSFNNDNYLKVSANELIN